ncbi:MAG: restriction endonuclease, partial [Deltaproteobacteria bacterium]|nr:restriction endonuclease [Deltaproteobacteria bacterium]
AMERKLLTFVGRTPEVTMQTQLTSAVKKAPGAPFVRVKPGVFGLLRYPEAAPEPEAPVAAPAVEDKPAEPGESRGRRRRRGGRGRRRDRRDAESGSSEGATPSSKGGAVEGRDGETEHSRGLDEMDGAEEPDIGSLSAEARAAALAETGVLEGDNEDDDNGPDTAIPAQGADDASDEDESETVLAGGGLSEEAAREKAASGAEGGAISNGATAPVPATDTTPASGSGPAGASPTTGAGDATGLGGRKVMSPVDAAIEILKGQSPGRGVHVRQIADSAVRRRLVHGEPNEAWRVMRAALASEPKERLRAGLRPRIRSAGSGLFALSRRVADADLEKAEYVFGEARRALRERTLAALEQRLGELAASSFEAVARVLLQREGFGPATFVKRVEGTVYVEALRGRGFRPSRTLIALRPGMTAAGRRAIGELRAGVRARSQDEGLLLLAGRLSDEAIAEWKQAGQPIEVVDGPAMAETCVRHGIGVLSASFAVDLIDADFFAELAEG